MNTRSPIFVAGSGTLIGAALVERLRALGYGDLVGVDAEKPDLMCAGQMEDFFAERRPEYVFLAAGMSGGIALNQARPAELMRDNLLSAVHVMDAAHRHHVRKLLYLASSCSYPRDGNQPLQPQALMTGALEPTSAPYALAKLAGWQLCAAYRQQYGANFITGIPANAFGPTDDFTPAGGHVIPALIRRAHEAKEQSTDEMTVWGSGKPRREFIFAADLADACIFVMQRFEGSVPINLGSGISLSIAEVAHAVADVVGFCGRIRFDTTKPDGAPLKCLDSTTLHALGWQPRTTFRSALELTYQWFLQHELKEDHVNVPQPV